MFRVYYKNDILIPRQKPLDEFTPPENVVVVNGTNRTFNQDVICDSFIKRSLKPYILANDIEQAGLLIDQAPCHLTSKVKNTLKNNRASTVYVPKRFTNLLQPADVAWMKALKSAYHRLWTDWYSISSEF